MLGFRGMQKHANGFRHNNLRVHLPKCIAGKTGIKQHSVPICPGKWMGSGTQFHLPQHNNCWETWNSIHRGKLMGKVEPSSICPSIIIAGKRGTQHTSRQIDGKSGTQFHLPQHNNCWETWNSIHHGKLMGKVEPSSICPSNCLEKVELGSI